MTHFLCPSCQAVWFPGDSQSGLAQLVSYSSGLATYLCTLALPLWPQLPFCSAYPPCCCEQKISPLWCVLGFSGVQKRKPLSLAGAISLYYLEHHKTMPTLGEGGDNSTHILLGAISWWLPHMEECTKYARCGVAICVATLHLGVGLSGWFSLDWNPPSVTLQNSVGRKWGHLLNLVGSLRPGFS